eukprot:10677004-Lingulodinium_polyedra.AAC.1
MNQATSGPSNQASPQRTAHPCSRVLRVGRHADKDEDDRDQPVCLLDHLSPAAGAQARSPQARGSGRHDA